MSYLSVRELFSSKSKRWRSRIRVCLLFSYFVLLISAGGEDMNMNRRNRWNCWNCGQLVWKDISFWFDVEADMRGVVSVGTGSAHKMSSLPSKFTCWVYRTEKTAINWINMLRWWNGRWGICVEDWRDFMVWEIHQNLTTFYRCLKTFERIHKV